MKPFLAFHVSWHSDFVFRTLSRRSRVYPRGPLTAAGDHLMLKCVNVCAAYGNSLIGRVFAVPSGVDGCSPIAANSSWGMNYILLIPRGGGCSFETKVYNAQLVGAAGALVGDTYLMCGDANANVCNTLCSNYCGYRNMIPDTVPNPNDCECILPYMAGV